MRRRVLRDTVVLALALAIACLLQVTIAHDFMVLGGAPDLVCLVVVGAALLRGPEAGALVGFSGGFLLDALAGTPLGLSSLVYASVGYGAGRLGEGLDRRAAVRPLAIVAAASVAARVGTGALVFMLGTQAALGQSLGVGLVATAALDVLLAIPLYPLLRRLLAAPAPASAPTATGHTDDAHPVVA